jgi:molybdopterin-containing oxidoreductase family iron-sulfur binding subunit
MDKFKDIEFNILDNNENKDPDYWRGFKELYNDADFQNAKNEEFIGGTESDSTSSGFSRRKFLALLGVSAAFAAAGCSNYKNKGEIIPYNKKPEEITPGIADYYSSTCDACSDNCGILIKTREGRPIKINGNPDHPVSKGKICARGQANILNLYDPDRIKEPLVNLGNDFVKTISWNDADEKIISALKSSAASGKEIAILSHTISSPAFKKLLIDFTTIFPSSKVYTYELVNNIHIKDAFIKSYGNENIPAVNISDAKVILSLESDFLSGEYNRIENVRMFSQGREVVNGEKFSRFYSVEGNASVTGFNADYRIRLRTDAIEEFVLSILNEILIKKRISKFNSDKGVISIINQYSLDSFISKNKLDKKIIETLINDLIENQGKSIMIAGLKLPETTHIIVNFLNEVLGNVNLYSKESIIQDLIPLSKKKDLESLISKMQSGQVGVMIVADSNPVYHFPADYNFTEIFKNIPLTITLTETANETSSLSSYILPINHTVESWGDYKNRTGFYSLQQPVIAPLYNTRQKEAVLLNWLNGNKNYKEEIYHEYLKNNWEKNIYPSLQVKSSFKNFWFASLHDGVAYSNEKINPFTNFKTDAFVNAVSSSKLKQSKSIVLLLNSSSNLGDGRFASNGWLQELPHPVSKIVWDNYAAISPETAKAIGIKLNDVIEISVDKEKILIPAFIQPGMADDVISVDLGYGRIKAGKIGSDVGVNAAGLIQSKNQLTNWLMTDVSINKTGKKYELVSTQEHYPIDNERYKDIHLKRHIIREGTLLQFKKEPDFIEREKPFPSINEEHKYPGVKWAMAIDLNKCIGCSECIASCNVENNIPVVGKEQVKANREMHWIRIDRYYSGTPQEPKASFQPMLCQHCDFAPCENVCPVAATTHSTEGLNAMAYNRCVGTRYCSNNCPYKVRRFNFFNYRNYLADGYYEQESLSLMYNPEVTVRSRGVMEKCTFCLQRIMEARQEAIKQGRTVKGEDVKTACQEACPSNAIVFGDMNDKSENEFKKYHEHTLGYSVLDEIKVLPNITYIAKLRNITEEKSEK